MPETFPLFRLPLLVQLLIIKFLTLGEQFEFSLLSEKCKCLVKSLEIKVASLSWKLWSGNRNYYQLILPGLQFTIPLERDKTDKRILINDKLHPVCRYLYGNDIRIDVGEERKSSREHLKLMEQLSELVLELFQPKEFKVSLTGFENIVECFVWKYCKQFKELAINPCCYTRSWRSLQSSELTFALRTLKSERFCQDGPVSYFSYSGTLRMKSLEVASGNWISLEGWKKMKCRSVFITSDSLSDKKLNDMIKAWVAGEGMKKLRTLHMTVSPDQAPYGGHDRRIPQYIRLRRLETIVKDIETLPLRPSRNDYPNRQTMEGFEIRRTDGITAYVAFSTDCLTSFKFQVDQKEEDSDSDESVVSEYLGSEGDGYDEEEDSEDSDEEQEDSDDNEGNSETEDSEDKADNKASEDVGTVILL